MSNMTIDGSRVTIGDVAARAGVSIATVSRVVNERYGVAAEHHRPGPGRDRRTRLRVEPRRPQPAQPAHERHRHPRRRHRAVQRRTAEGRRPGAPRIRLTSSSSTPAACAAEEGWERRYLSRLSGTLADGTILVTPTVVEVDADPSGRRRRPARRRIDRCRPSTPRTSRAPSRPPSTCSSSAIAASDSSPGAPTSSRRAVARPGYRAALERGRHRVRPGPRRRSAGSPRRPPRRRRATLLHVADRADGDLRRQRPVRHPGDAHGDRARHRRARRTCRSSASTTSPSRRSPIRRSPPSTSRSRPSARSGTRCCSTSSTTRAGRERTARPRHAAHPPRRPAIVEHRRLVLTSTSTARRAVLKSFQHQFPSQLETIHQTTHDDKQSHQSHPRGGSEMTDDPSIDCDAGRSCSSPRSASWPPRAAATTTRRCRQRGTGHRRSATENSTAADSGGDGEPVEIDWWHIQNNDPGKADWQAMADAYMAEHPNVKINITVMENEAFKAALQTNLQAGDVPDLFQSWGGGGLRDQVDAGLVQDITDASSGFVGDLSAGATRLYQVDGKQYGVPYNASMVGFWYNKDLFAQAGIDAPPDDLGRAARRRPDAEGRRDHPDRRRGRRQVAGPLLVLVPDDPPRRGRRDEPDRRRQQLQCPDGDRGRREGRRPRRTRTVPGRLPRCRLGCPRRRVRHDGQRRARRWT